MYNISGCQRVYQVTFEDGTIVGEVRSTHTAEGENSVLSYHGKLQCPKCGKTGYLIIHSSVKGKGGPYASVFHPRNYKDETGWRGTSKMCYIGVVSGKGLEDLLSSAKYYKGE